MQASGDAVAFLRLRPEHRAAADRLSVQSLMYAARPAAADSPADLARDLDGAVQLLEQLVLGACAAEALAEDPRLDAVDWRAHVQVHSGIELERWERDQPPAPPGPSIEELAREAPSALPEIVAYAQAHYASCPIGALEEIADRLGDPQRRHRARLAYDRLHAFLVRRDPTTDERLKVIGRLYAAGQVSIGEAAGLLASSVPDAIALLEPRGYARPLETLGLSEPERERIFGALRVDRERRAGRPEPSEDRVRRSAIASERIEGIDARAWLADD